MHEIETPCSSSRGVLVGKLLCFRINARLAGIDKTEETLPDLIVDFGEDGFALIAGDFSSIDSIIQGIPNFQ